MVLPARGSIRSCFFVLLCGVGVVAASSLLAQPTTKPLSGLAQYTPEVVALVGATVVPEPGKSIENGTIVIRDGRIEAVGADVEPPADARVIEVDGKTIYAGFIDAYGEMELPSRTDRGPHHWNDLITPERGVADYVSADANLNKTLRSQGICTRLVAPRDGVLKGTSAIISTADGDADRIPLASDVALHARLTVPFGRSREEYPNSPMGAVALARQTMLDAAWYVDAWRAYRLDSSPERPEINTALAALEPYIRGVKPLIIDAQNELYALRADRFAVEFALGAMLRGSGHEYKRLDAIAATDRAIIVPVDFPSRPKLAAPEDIRETTLAELLHWHFAPENPARLQEAGVSFAFTSHGLNDRKTFLQQLRTAVERGLTAEDALAALTIKAARLFNLEGTLGTIAPGKTANLVIADGPLFEKKTKIHATWIEGEEYLAQQPALFSLSGSWQLRLSKQLGGERRWELKVPAGERPKAATLLHPNRESDQDESDEEAEKGDDDQADEENDAAPKIELKNVRVSNGRLSATLPGKKLNAAGTLFLSAAVIEAEEGESQLVGSIRLPDGKEINFTAQRTTEDEVDEEAAKEESDQEEDEDAEDEASDEDSDDLPTEKESEEESDDEESDDENSADENSAPNLEDVALNYPLGAWGRDAAPDQSEWVVFENATVWTSGPDGVLKNAAVVVHRDKIHAVGPSDEIDIPDGAVRIDAAGQHITPGIIDCHSHMATDGGINESTQAITAEVRIGDFIDADDINIYRQLAGGVTAANILHGSANPIGGQNQVIKLRWGALPEEMKLEAAPQGIKFALGENVKQSNWGDDHTTRYPQTRMGVEQIIRDAFHRAEAYQQEWKAWRQGRRGLPPRRDLELDALAEIVQGDRWVHCHSYRQDEILALIRTLDDFDITIGTFQHILEGYKVAPEMAAHGAMGSSFSDWWAYKFEVYDAIPYNGALMHEAGVVVSFNSDDRELARHLNHEAAKAVKYGNVPPDEALNFVTINPARQLRIEEHVGSLEPGKDADLVVWSGPPLSTLSRCEQTWIDGRKYFDRSDDAKNRRQMQELKNRLVQAALAEPGGSSGDNKDEDDSHLWPREDLFCHGHDH